MSELPLFEGPAPAPAPTASPESADRARTRRQRELLAAGRHPLTAVLTRPLRLHAEAAPADDRQAPGRRCGGCRFRQTSGWGFPKCMFGDGIRASRGAATDCRAWWPACVDHQGDDDA